MNSATMNMTIHPSEASGTQFEGSLYVEAMQGKSEAGRY
jgi:hypothetical protein